MEYKDIDLYLLRSELMFCEPFTDDYKEKIKKYNEIVSIEMEDE